MCQGYAGDFEEDLDEKLLDLWSAYKQHNSFWAGEEFSDEELLPAFLFEVGNRIKSLLKEGEEK